MNRLKDIILLGEVHGTEANIRALQFMVRHFENAERTVVVALELPLDWGEAFNQFNAGESQALKSLLKERGEEYESGRISAQHVAMYESLSGKGVTFYPIRKDMDDWNETDANMAKNIHQLAKAHADKIVLVVIGNMHAQKNSFKATWFTGSKNYWCRPVGEILSEDATSIMIRYKNCEYKNCNSLGILSNEGDVSSDKISTYPTLLCDGVTYSGYDCELWLQNGQALNKS